MDHKTIQRKLLRYLDDELSEKERSQVRHHLKNCRTCRDGLKAIESMWVSEQPIERQTAPPFLWTRISAQLEAKAEKKIFKGLKKPLRLALRPILTIVVLFFIFYSGINLGKLMTGSSESVTEISTARITDNFGSSYFEILPPGSLDAQVLALDKSEIQK